LRETLVAGWDHPRTPVKEIRMNKIFSRTIHSLLLVAATASLSASSRDLGSNTGSASLLCLDQAFAQKNDSVIVSPDKKKALFIRVRYGRKELWVMNVDGAAKRKLISVWKGEGVMSPVWSPDGRLVAFVRYNLAGHSPMTTTHVWIVRSDGRGAREVMLPKPNQRFSTYDPRWKNNWELILKATTLADSTDQHYLYNCRTGRIQKINQQHSDREK
jgi:Tol biopolymer transport system component